MSTVEVEDKLSENDYNMNKIDYLYNLIQLYNQFDYNLNLS